MRAWLLLMWSACAFDPSRIDPTIDPPPPDTCLDESWCRRKQIAFANVAGGPHADFPALIQISGDSELAASVRDDGFDLRFTAGDGVTALPYERVELTATGDLLAWVRVPQLVGSTKLWLYYGYPDAADQQDVAGTWNASYRGVWHFDDAAGGSDSTSHGNDATAVAGPVQGPGRVGRGMELDGNNDLLRIPNHSSLDETAARGSFAMWLRPTDAAAGRFQLVLLSSNTFANPADGFSWSIQPDGDHYFYPWVGDEFDFNLIAAPFSDGTWHHAAVNFDFATKNVQLFVDGAPRLIVEEHTSTSWTQIADPADWLLGGGGPPNEHFGGTLDEVRVASEVRSADWIATEFANQSAPSTFVTVGVEDVLE